jgi:hypothetical protein
MTVARPAPTESRDGLVETLRGLADRAGDGGLSLGEMLDSVEEASFAFVCILLALPFLQPFSLGPLSTVGGLTFAVIGWQLFRGHPSPVLPEKLRRTVLSRRALETLAAACLKVLGFLARFCRERHATWVVGERGRRVAGLTVIAGGLLMAVPFFGLPLNNMLPGLAIFFVSIAQLERDGLMVLVAFVWLAVTVIYFTFVLGVIWMLGEQAIESLTFG